MNARPPQWDWPVLKQIANTVWSAIIGYDGPEGIMPGFGFTSLPVEQPDGSWLIVLGAQGDGAVVAHLRLSREDGR